MSIRTHVERLDCPPMPILHPQALPTLPVPPAPPIRAPPGQPGPGRTPRPPPARAWLGPPPPAGGPGGRLPHLHPRLTPRIAQKLPIRTPRHAIEGGLDVLGLPQDLPSL